MSILVSIKNITKTYTHKNTVTHALNNVSFDINKGEIVSLLGVNGAGKTTLSLILASLIPPTTGDVVFNGTSIYKTLMTFRHILGFCPQKPNFDKRLTVEENLLYDGRYYGFSEIQVKERAKHLAEQFALTPYLQSKIETLSGGYKQRLIIARELMHNPTFFVLDEPTVGLDPQIRHTLWGIIQQLKKQGVTILITTHYMDEADVLSDRVVILDKGSIRTIDTPENLKSTYNKNTLEDVFLHLLHNNDKESV